MLLQLSTQYLAQQLLNVLVLSGYYALIAVGLTIVYGTLGIINFAHGAFYMLGAFATVFLAAAGLPYVVAALGAVLVTALAGAFVERTTSPILPRDPSA